MEMCGSNAEFPADWSLIMLRNFVEGSLGV